MRVVIKSIQFTTIVNVSNFGFANIQKIIKLSILMRRLITSPTGRLDNNQIIIQSHNESSSSETSQFGKSIDIYY